MLSKNRLYYPHSDEPREVTCDLLVFVSLIRTLLVFKAAEGIKYLVWKNTCRQTNKVESLLLTADVRNRVCDDETYVALKKRNKL